MKAALAAALMLAANAGAQSYPTKPIRFVVGFGVGGGNDMIARAVSRKLTESMGQQVIVDNRAGGAGVIAAVIVAKAPADGYTLFSGTVSTLATNVSMHDKLPYDPVRDFAPVTTTTLSPYLLGVNPGLPAATMKEFLALAKNPAARINFASAGPGSANHLSQELLKTMAGLTMTHVPYKGAGDQLTALIGGEVQMSCIQVQVALTQARAGRIRALAVTGAQRLAVAPDIPTIAESGVAGFDATSWQGVVVPAGTPAAIVQRLHSEIVKALKAPDLGERVQAEGATTGGISPEAFAALIKSEITKWARVVKAASLRAG